MNELAQLIRTRGSWRVTVRPARFVEERLSFVDLMPIVERSSVRLRGWAFPHIANRDPITREVEWIGQESRWEQYLEIWRMYTSGQFYYLGGMPEDWRDESNWWPPDQNWSSGSRLGISDTIYTYREIFEFAARLSLTAAGDDAMHISITCSGLRGRSLYGDNPNRAPIVGSYSADLEAFPFVREISRDELVSNTIDLASRVALDLFSRFGWAPTIDHVREVANELQAQGGSV